MSPALEMKLSSPALQTRPLSFALGAESIGVDFRQEMDHGDHRVTAQVLEALSFALGAEILGIDLRQETDDWLAAQVLEARHENLVTLLRGQHLSEQDQVRFAERFGPRATIHTKQFIQKHSAVMLISNIREDG